MCEGNISHISSHLHTFNTHTFHTVIPHNCTLHTSITHVIMALKQGGVKLVLYTPLEFTWDSTMFKLVIEKEYYIHIGQLRAQGSCISYKSGQYTIYWPAFCFDTWLHHATTWLIAVCMWCLDIRKRLFVTATDGSDSELPNWLQHLQRKAFFCSTAINLLAKHVKSWSALSMHDAYPEGCCCKVISNSVIIPLSHFTFFTIYWNDFSFIQAFRCFRSFILNVFPHWLPKW